jgi:hypothetical protein
LFLGRRGVEYQASPASGILSQYISAIAMPIDWLAKTAGTQHHLGGDEVLTVTALRRRFHEENCVTIGEKKRRKTRRRKNPVNY